MIMKWKITNRNDRDNYVDAISIEPIDYEYHGFMENFQPNGYGALCKDGIQVKCGYWKNGELSDENQLSHEEYQKIMNKYFNS